MTRNAPPAGTTPPPRSGNPRWAMVLAAAAGVALPFALWTLRGPTDFEPTALVGVRPVTADGTYKMPRFSPDGRWLAAGGWKFTGVHVLDAAGVEPPRTLSGEDFLGWGARWDGPDVVTRSRDGREIAFRDAAGKALREETGQVWDAARGPGPVHAWIADEAVHLRVGDRESVVSDGKDRYFRVVASPDGGALAFEGLETGLHVLDLQDRSDAALGVASHTVWMPDGSGVIYAVTRDDGSRLLGSELWFWGRRTGHRYPLTASPDLLELYPDVSPDGGRVAFESEGRVYVGTLQ
jgi:dipeptidyl aminopeptidase/acylaminoacyl peptidase